MATSLVAAIAMGLPPEKAMAELHRGFKRIIKREGLSPGDIAYLRERSTPSAWRTGRRRGLERSRTVERAEDLCADGPDVPRVCCPAVGGGVAVGAARFFASVVLPRPASRALRVA
ncbi:hypothetical protein SSP24_26080 [Streptomyces spinoverrucosus]|uniref:Uncharacterized protein n=1 Tax=Streptomyces spinoverrucosus TaxID=284043 RepID=A0A4Y3VER6_9ACTN|nr:hypothetical protein SSP24_26080 [Streptomyces spinoverrucosus]GHB60911.1 hypothetical protein GCM10010397_33920 [Streptomyces spinoverrucosus]